MEIYSSTGIKKTGGGVIYARCQPAHIGGSIGVSDYIANCINGTALTTTALSINTLYAFPFVAPNRGGTLDRIAAEVIGTQAAKNFEIGIYANKTDNTDVYPGARLDHSGSISTASAALKTYTISQALTPGKIYWLAINTDANTGTFRTMAVGSISAFLGIAIAATTLANLGVTVASTFASAPMPDPFPASGSYITAVPLPVLRYRFSA